MRTFLLVVQVVLSLALIMTIIVQQKGAGLSATFGGSGGFIPTKRGAEKLLENLTIIIAILFVLNSVAFLFVK